MFQYGFGRAIAARHAIPVCFDTISGFHVDPYRRQLELGQFNVNLEKADVNKLPFGINLGRPWRQLHRLVSALVPNNHRKVIYEKRPYQFDDYPIRSAGGSKYYIGYWQNPKYFSQIGAELSQAFTLRDGLSTRAKQILCEIRQSKSVSIHIRSYKEVANLRGRMSHIACEPSYVQNALKLLTESDNQFTAFIFTDDLNWTIQNFHLPPSARMITPDDKLSPAEELVLMSNCEEHIISSSSFSWWGAWLSGRSGKRVIAPALWSRLPHTPSSVLAPRDWILV